MEQTPQDIRRTSRWKSISSRMRRKYPLCHNPFKMHSFKPADEVHHIIPVANLLSPEDRHLIFDTRNLVCLCYQCHRKVEAMNRKGIDTKALFNDRHRGYKNLYEKRTAIKRKPKSTDTQITFWGGGCQTECKKVDSGFFCGTLKAKKDFPCGNCKLKQWNS